MKILVAILRNEAKGPLLCEEPNRPERSLLELVEESSSEMSSIVASRVRKSEGDRNKLSETGSVELRAGLSAFKEVVSRMSAGTSTGMLTLTAAA